MAKPKASWTITLEDGPHTVEVFQRGRKITLMFDGVAQQEFTAPIIDTGGDYPVQIRQYPGMLHGRSNTLTTKYDLSINGRSVTTNQPVQLLGPVPGWAWVFVVLCALIPIISVGGAIPTGLGAAGGVGSYILSRNTNLSVAARVAGCLALTILCWALFVGLAVMVGRG